MTTIEKFRSHAFLRLEGPVFFVRITGSDVAQAVFKGRKVTERFAAKVDAKLGARVEEGKFSDDGRHIIPKHTVAACEAQAQINSRDRMAAERQRIETRRAPGW